MTYTKSESLDGSYKLESFTDNRESEVNRLKFQVNLFYQKEFELYKKIGLRDGMNIIECGSGPGFLIGNIVRDLSHCTATAVEIDPFLVDQLNLNSIINGKKMFEVKHASIYQTELPDNCFDFAITRLVLEHLTEPDKALAEVRRILKPGGKLVIVSNDFAYHLLTYPLIPELDLMYNAYIKSRYSEGGNPLIGRQLPVFLKNEMFEEINIEIICVHTELEGDKPFLKAENVNISKSLVKDGFLKETVLESLMDNWYKMLQHPDHLIFRQLFVASGTKSSKVSDHNSEVSELNLARSDNKSLTINSLHGLTSSDQETQLSIYFKEKVNKILEHSDLDIDLNKKLNDLDIDSISAAELASIVKLDFKTIISISDILQTFSINDIIKRIMINLGSDSTGDHSLLNTELESSWLEGEL